MLSCLGGNQYPICRLAARSALRRGRYNSSMMAKLPAPCSPLPAAGFRNRPSEEWQQRRHGGIPPYGAAHEKSAMANWPLIRPCGATFPPKREGFRPLPLQLLAVVLQRVQLVISAVLR